MLFLEFGGKQVGIAPQTDWVLPQDIYQLYAIITLLNCFHPIQRKF